MLGGRTALSVLGVVALAGFVALQALLAPLQHKVSLLPNRNWLLSRQLTDFQCALPSSSTVDKKIDPRSHPTVAIIGTAKGGTTDAFQLVVHGLNFTAPARKEIGHMSDLKMDVKNQVRLRYLAKLNHPCTQGIHTSRWKHTCVKATDALTIEASMAYLERPHAPARFRELSPGTKTIVMLREPVERAASLFNHWTIGGERLLDRTLEECAQIFLAWVQSEEGAAQMSLLSSANDVLSMHEAYQKFMSSKHSTELHIFFGFLYAYQLSTWMVDFFEPGNVLVLDSHLYYSLNRGDALTLLSQYVFGHGPTDEQIVAASAIDIQNAKLHVGLKANTTYLEDSTVLRLQQVFAPFNLKLLDLLNCMRTGGYSVAGFDADLWVYPTTLR